MAMKSIVDIELNDSKFKAYVAAYQKYEALLGKQPEAWKKVGQSIDNTRSGMDKLVASVNEASKNAGSLQAIHEKATLTLKDSNRTWELLVRNSKYFADNIVTATRSLLTWAGVTTALGGLLGAGGLFGIERLAQNAAGGRASAGGLGVTPGQQRAFGINYGRLGLSTNSVLSGVNAALTDPAQLANLARVGITNTQGKDAAQVSAELIQKLHDMTQNVPTNLLGTYAKAWNVQSLGISEEDLRRIRDRPQGELDEIRKGFTRDSGSLNVSDETGRAWERLKAQLDRASQLIETRLITALSGLAPQIEHLSAGFADFITKLLGSNNTKHLLDDLAVGLGKLGDVLTSPEFFSQIDKFIGEVKDFGESFSGFFDIFKEGIGKLNEIKDSLNGIIDWENNIGGLLKQFQQSDPTTNSPHPGPQGLVGNTWWNRIFHPSSFSGGAGPAFFQQIEASRGLPGGVLDAIWAQESGRGANKGPSRTGAVGDFQFEPGTWSTYGGGGNPWNLQDSAGAAGRYLQKLLGEFGGDIAKAVAAYNAGEGTVEKDIARARREGGRWQDYLPAETKGYLNHVLPHVGGGGQEVAVRIYNNTGGNAVAVASAMA